MSSKNKSLKEKEFERIMENMAFRKKATEFSDSKPYLPLDMGIALTGRCNLRCKHCFEWNEHGFLTNSDRSCAEREIPIDKIKECLEYTRPAKTRLYLWGGEPLLYSKFPELCQLLKEDPRWTTVCTNGLLIRHRLDDLLQISENLVLLISLDGFREGNDSIRGKGTFDKVIDTIRMLIKLSSEGVFKGEVSVCCVISDQMADRLYEYCELMEELQINTLYLSFPWYISPEVADRMDVEFEKRFGDLISIDDDAKASWHDFTFHISEDRIETIRKEMARIAERKWKIRIRFQPDIKAGEVEDFVKGGELTAQERSKCLAINNRIDILQGGEVSSCKLFREFSVGNLNSESIKDIWEGDRMKQMRERLKCGLMPVCSKCVLLYLNGE